MDSGPFGPTRMDSSEKTEGLHQVALLLAWQGQGFVGWQRQPNGRSVQAELEAALAKLHGGESVSALAAGRTDAGVHAWSQLVTYRTHRPRSPEVILRALASLLPTDVGCHAVGSVPTSFHPVRDTFEKHYRYRILETTHRCPFRDHYTWRLPGLSLEAMLAAAPPLVGRHDWSTFRASGCSSPDPVKEVRSLHVHRVQDELWIDVRGDGFLRHQVRIMVGTLVEVGAGRRPPEWPARALAACSRPAGGPTAPPEGLWLISGRTDPPVDWRAGTPPLEPGYGA
jgi:tRNA pseudouridine38-40 synthase